jgi:uncharacterized protein (TIGR02268 family)
VLTLPTLLGLALLASPGEATEKPPRLTCESGARYIELDASRPSQVPEVCIRPALTTTMLFDAELARVEVEEPRHFRRVSPAGDTLLLIPSEGLVDGVRVPVTVYFKDGAAPVSASFVLVVHPSEAERQVEVSRHPRTLESFRQGEQQAQAQAQQCREEKARLQAECSGRSGLTGLIASGLLGEDGVTAQRLRKATLRPGSFFELHGIISYRAGGTGGRGRVAVEVELKNMGTTPWAPVGAALVGPNGKVLGQPTVWLLEPIAPGWKQRVVVEVEATGEEAQGTFTLKLWALGGADTSVLLDGVTFP